MYEEEIEEARIEAKNNLRGIITEEQIGYGGYLKKEMQKILREKGIDWQKEEEEIIRN
ncbi:MAG: hypothetical protein IJT21_00650 [Synergistaceae bacterium]|nr:hypothetical protein [Synergistaceae bacterium]